jgi:hypothetical protein
MFSVKLIIGQKNIKTKKSKPCLEGFLLADLVKAVQCH